MWLSEPLRRCLLATCFFTLRDEYHQNTESKLKNHCCTSAHETLGSLWPRLRYWECRFTSVRGLNLLSRRAAFTGSSFLTSEKQKNLIRKFLYSKSHFLLSTWQLCSTLRWPPKWPVKWLIKTVNNSIVRNSSLFLPPGCPLGLKSSKCCGWQKLRKNSA